MAKGQYEPTFKTVSKWNAIKDEKTAIAAVKASKGWDEQTAKNAINEAIKAIKDKSLQNNSRTFIQTRTEFLGYYPKSKNAKDIVHRTSPSNSSANGGNNYFYWEYAGKSLIGKTAPSPPDFSKF